MKKIYFRPETNVLEMDATEMLAGSPVMEMDGSNTIENEEDVWTNKKNMWGKENPWS